MPDRNHPLLAKPKPLIVREVQPARMLRRDEGWFVDFGRAAFGTVRLEVEWSGSGPADLVVHLGERLAAEGVIDRNPPGTIRYRRMTEPLRSGRHTIQVVIPPDELNTAPEAIHMPPELFEVMPFRYAEIESPVGLTIHAVTQLAVQYPFDETAAAFRCSDERLNRIWDLCHYSIQATTFCGVYVDGDRERIPYEGDAYINQLGHYGVDDDYELARHSLEYLLFHPTWPTEWQLHCVPMAWADYQYTGDASLLERYYDVLREKTLLALAREDGLISSMTGLVTPEFLQRMRLDEMLDVVDWPPAAPEMGVPGERDDYDMVPVKTIVNAFHWWNLDLFARIAGVLGREEERAFFAERAQLVAESLHRVCFDPARGIYTDGEGSDHASLHANMLPAAVGLVPGEHAASANAFIRSRGMACSVYGSQYLLEGLYRLGDAEHALALMTAEHDRGWLRMLEVGSTITLEAWDVRYKSNLDWNHAWGAAPANIIPRWLMGVRSAAPGFGEIRVMPQPAGLTWAQAKVPTRHGPVELEIEQTPEGSFAQLTLTVPAGSTATVDLSRMCPPETRLIADGDHETARSLRERAVPEGVHRITVVQEWTRRNDGGLVVV